MKLRLIVLWLVCAVPLMGIETEISAPETGIEREETTSELESEGHGIIPAGGLTFSTQPITPITLLPEKDPQSQALTDLDLARSLLKKGKTEAASDVALKAYDDLMSLRLPRRNKTKRKQMRLVRRQAATVYIEASLAYIQGYVKRTGQTEAGLKEGRARLGDLRDVAQNYPELMKKVNQVMGTYVVSSSTTSL